MYLELCAVSLLLLLTLSFLGFWPSSLYFAALSLSQICLTPNSSFCFCSGVFPEFLGCVLLIAYMFASPLYSVISTLVMLSLPTCRRMCARCLRRQQRRACRTREDRRKNACFSKRVVPILRRGEPLSVLRMSCAAVLCRAPCEAGWDACSGAITLHKGAERSG